MREDELAVMSSGVEEGASATAKGAEALILAAARVASFDWNLPERRVRVSPEYLLLHGLDPEAPLEFAYPEYTVDRAHPDDRALLLQCVRNALANGGSFDIAYRIICARTGEARWIHDRGAVLMDDDGRPLRLLSAQSDITQRKRAEEALRESEERFRIAADSAPAPVWMTNRAGEMEFANQAMLEFAGIAADALTGSGWIELLHPEDRANVLANRAAAWTEGPRAYAFTARFRRKDGQWRWLLVSSRPRTNPHGEFEGYVGLAIDQTDSMLAAESLRESEARFRIIANSTPAPVWVTDSRGAVEFGNDAFQEFAGRPAKEMRGEAWINFLHPDDLPYVMAERAKAWAEGPRAYIYEARFRRADGQWRWLEVRSKPRLGADREFLGYVGLATDRTDARIAEASLRESEERFRLMADHAPVMIWMSDTEGRCTHINRMMREFWDVREDALADFDWSKTLHSEDRVSVLETVEAALRAQRAFTCEGRYRNAAGDYRVLRTTASARISAAGEFLGMIGVNIDVTDFLHAEDALRSSKARLDLITNAMPALISYVDKDCRYRFVNDAYEKWFGRKQEDIVGMEMREILGDAVWEIIEPRVADTLSGKEAVFDSLLPYSSASRHVSARYIPHIAESGEVEGFFVLVHDISERIRSEEALRASEARYRAIVESQSEMVCRFRRDGTIVFVNEAYARSRGETVEKLCASSFWDFIPATDRAHVEARLDTLSPETPEVLIENRFETAAGARWTLWRNRALAFDASGRFVEAQSTGIDITDRKLAERALQQSEERLRAIFETAVDAIVVIDERGVVQSLNPAAEKTFGYAPDEVVGRNVSMLMPEPHAQSHDGYLNAYLDSGVRKIIGIGREVEGRRKDGSLFPLELAIGEWRDAQGARFFTGTMRDITERKRSEELRTLLIDELDHRVKNTLAIVQGLAQQTFRAGEEAAAARRAFEGRLAALAGAHTLLTTANWESASLRALAEGAIRDCGIDAERVSVDGPLAILAPKQAVTLAIALHELCTNAIKYGALSNETGMVELGWKINADAPGLHIEWRERGGPPVSPPTRRGFGTRMIEQALAHELDGRVRMDFRPDGLVCVMDLAAPLGRAAAE